MDVDSFPLSDEMHKFVVSQSAIESIESLSESGFEDSLPLPETMSDSLILSSIVSPEFSIRKVCSEKVFARTFSVFISEKMFPVSTLDPTLYGNDASMGNKWKRTNNTSIRSQINNSVKYVFFKKKSSKSNIRTGVLQIAVFHDGENGVEVP